MSMCGVCGVSVECVWSECGVSGECGVSVECVWSECGVCGVWFGVCGGVSLPSILRSQPSSLSSLFPSSSSCACLVH